MAKKRVLILCYYYPPSISIAAKRPASWVKEFPKHDIHPVIVTRKWPENMTDPQQGFESSKDQNHDIQEQEDHTVIRVPYNPSFREKLLLSGKLSLLRRVLTFFNMFLKFVHPAFDINSIIQSAADEYLSKNKVDLIIPCGEPFIMFMYAHRLSKKYNIPWTPDYRDGWTTNQYLDNFGFIRSKIIKYYNRIEKRIINPCPYVTVASPSYKTDLIEKSGIVAPIHVINNGYDKEIVAKAKIGTPPSDVFTIAYGGTLYPFQQLEEFLAGFRQFIKKTPGAKVRIIFYGMNFQPEMKQRLLSYDSSINQYFQTTDHIPYLDLISALSESHVLLLLTNRDVNLMNTKVYDYLMAKREILLVPNDNGVLNDILQECKTGEIANSQEEICNYLQDRYGQFTEGKYITANAENVEKYSRSYQAAKLADLINQSF